MLIHVAKVFKINVIAMLIVYHVARISQYFICINLSFTSDCAFNFSYFALMQ